MKPAIRQTAMRRSIYAQLALDAAAVAVELWFFWGDGQISFLCWCLCCLVR